LNFGRQSLGPGLASHGVKCPQIGADPGPKLGALRSWIATTNFQVINAMNASLLYTEPLVRRAVRRFSVRVVGWIYPLALVLMLASILMDLLRGDHSWWVGVMGAVLAMAVVFPIFLYRNQLSAALFKFRALKGEPVVFQVSESSFAIRSAAGSAELPWHAITEVWRYDDCWLLLFSKAHFMTFPLANVTSEMQSFVLERIREKGGKLV
jgi:hypothetical protein